ncbi:ubiquitin thiolesterase [Aspergillus luchuensis]|uniref:Ubiquitin thiolesterase n=1 Tax=Aspergillus kawachii TaxID=1069201 RepID=A0A146FQW5_ASPKA|nr:ubiquitin thiolesterase [Aspergillus luchuensis]
MSLSDLPWNRFDPINHFPTGQDSTSGFYPQHPHSSAFFDHGYSQLSNALYHPGNTFFFNMNTLSTAEMERFQKLSNEFQPDVQGPPVSTKQSSSVIAMEYANADPTFATKTNVRSFTGHSSNPPKWEPK